MTRNVPALLKEPPVAMGKLVISSQDAILTLSEPTQRSLLAGPESEYRDALHFYWHDLDCGRWLILGDSLTVIASLARRKDRAGKVQMIYMDLPAGVRFASNF